MNRLLRKGKFCLSQHLLYTVILSSLLSISYGNNDVRLSVETGHSATINKVVYNHDYTLMASAGADNNIAIWHLQTGKQYANYALHEKSVNDIIFHPEKNILYAVSSDSSFSIWDVQQDKLLAHHSLKHPLYSLDYRSNRYFSKMA